MPPKKAAAHKLSTSKTLIRTGPKDIEVSKRKKDGKSGVLPTTERALVLRNGKQGARGTGEVILVSKLTGREKLDLLAEDIIEKSKNSLGVPFRLKECQKIAESQLCEYLDDIVNLQDPDLFTALIEEEIKARARPPADKNATDPARNPSFIGETVAIRIHNTYLLASAWRIVADTLIELENDGVTDMNVKTRLREDEEIRARYIILFDMVHRLVDLGQSKFSVLATTTPHYAKYFKRVEQEQGDAEMIFDWKDLKEAARSFLDSIVIELCFPRAPYPRSVLYEILHDAVDEAPKDAKRFPQALWNAVGDLAYCVELQQILEGPLLGPEGEAWRSTGREMPREVENWIDAQAFSLKAAEKFASFKDNIYPLSRTRDSNVLDNMWRTINANYKNVSGHDADSLWQLEDALLHPTPKWSHIRIKESDWLQANDAPPRIQGKKKPMLITSGEDDTDESMPELQDVSDSSEDEAYSDSDQESESDDDDDGSSGYDTDQEDELRELLREAMDTTVDWFHSADLPAEDDPFKEEDRKGNPFLKLLGSLRGRMFSSSSKLKTMPDGHKPDASRIPKMNKPAKPKPKKTTPTTGAPGSLRTMIEEEEDEDDVSVKKKKKKKPKKKKKKSAAAPADGGESEDEEEAPAPASPVAAKAPAAPANPVPKAIPTKSPPPKTKAPSVAPSASTISLPIGETTAQSARSYLQAEHLDAPKVKVKTRSDQPNLFTKTKGVLSKFTFGGSDKEKEKEKEKDKEKEKEKEKDKEKEKPKESKSTRRSWFSHLGRKAKSSLHQLLNTAEDTTRGTTGMKWETFVKLMKDMGFQVDESTAGSSVRFDPPSANDRSISFHKPHPDTTIDRIKLKEWSKKLQKYYGWKPEDIMI